MIADLDASHVIRQHAVAIFIGREQSHSAILISWRGKKAPDDVVRKHDGDGSAGFIYEMRKKRELLLFIELADLFSTLLPRLSSVTYTLDPVRE